MVNFLALLGWSPGSGDEEVFTRDELVTRFTLGGVSGGNAVFNPEKLEWFNQQHIARLPIDELVRRVEPLLRDAGLWHEDLAGDRRPWLAAVMELLRPRARRLQDFVDKGRLFFADRIEYDETAVARHLSGPVRDAVAALGEEYARLPVFTREPLEAALRAVAAGRNIKPAALIHGARVAVTGGTVSPGLFETFELLGRDRVLPRLRALAGQADSAR
jgi:glutamyl-tRNA synthetase